MALFGVAVLGNLTLQEKKKWKDNRYPQQQKDKQQSTGV